MTLKEAEQYLKEVGCKGGPEQFKVGDQIDDNEIIEIKGLVNGHATYASTFVCKRAY